MDLGLEGKVIAVSGGGAGIGGAISRACLREGARVMVIGRASANVEEFMAEMKKNSAPCELIQAELGDPRQCKAAIAHILEQHGELYGLVNNAGANDGVGLEHGGVERFEESLRQNLVHYYALVHFALPALKSSQGADRKHQL